MKTIAPGTPHRRLPHDRPPVPTPDEARGAGGQHSAAVKQALVHAEEQFRAAHLQLLDTLDDHLRATYANELAVVGACLYRDLPRVGEVALCVRSRPRREAGLAVRRVAVQIHDRGEVLLGLSASVDRLASEIEADIDRFDAAYGYDTEAPAA